MDAGEGTENNNNNGIEQSTSSKVLEKVGNVVVSINEAKNVDQVIYALHSFAVRLFPLDSRTIAGSIDKQYRDEVIGAEVPSEHERDNWWQVFYQSTAFPTLARVLLVDVALNWLTCFPVSAKKHLYDVFVLRGCVSEVVQTLVPYLQHHLNGRLETSICSNTERLLALCLLENDGVLQLVREFSHQPGNNNLERRKFNISKVSQLVTSVPDKARLGASTLLSSHLYIKRITIQLIQGAEEWNKNYYDQATNFNRSDLDGSILFIGDAFARICRRGSTDLLLSEMVPRIVTQVQSVVQPGSDLTVSEAFKSKPGLQFWSKIMEAIKDSYAVERISEQLLHRLATQRINDVEGYWILWLLFHQIFELQSSIRSMFTERFLLWKLFPVCCLRWILQFSVLQCPPDTMFKVKSQNNCNLLDTTSRLLAVWSKREFVQSAPIEQQAYLTAAVGLCLEKLNKEDLDATKDAMHLILQGVSCRLESPSHLVRRMASSIALVFSKAIDPSNPLYLDENFKEETINWEFTSANADMAVSAISDGEETNINQDKSYKDAKIKNVDKELMELTLVDPDEVIDPATLNNEAAYDVDNDDDDDDVSETSSESSLQPYDLSDDDTDLKKNFSQLVDVVGALRKSDDADGVERALDVAEKLIRAAPDELAFIASDLVRTLVQVRCSDSTMEGEEESAEEKRQKALVALIVNCPLGSLDPINKLLYSPNVDTSQRIMILDVMTDAALELAHAKTARQKHPTRPQISTTAETQPWFMPSSIGPAGSSIWKEISGTESPLSLTYSYERDLPSKPGQVKRGKSRRWSVKSLNVVQDDWVEWSQNKFPPFAAAFMLPAMQGFDKKSQGVDFLGRDFIVLGKLIHMLGICMKCSAMHPEASALALPLLDMLSTREISHHAEAYVRKSVLFAASCILLALNPTYVASALVEGSSELARGLEWVRTWALSVADTDTDKECYTMAMACLHLHSEMALQTSRALESSDSVIQTRGISLPSNLSKGKIRISF
ncbi:putative telomere length regulation protein [Helianthus annuus]|uniref:Putative embryo defective protein n=1 Tax=Helianthus annuus TaxID=4232 RepID=A0A251UST4_HELAN|nr:telomere length regulation protein TEL2 homolog [Helianthus annuus]KAF5807033.1 putative telomere length regulation protein [Helianthus annuus]KAJ0585565.1 putative telomere length regulation protein [Helianthus annuus]KAJ0920141.1 putative telomere length regulation protein [Helianthus annuus]